MDQRQISSTSNVLRFAVKDSTTGALKTGLTSSSSGLIISVLVDTQTATTAYAQASSKIETISTLGTYAAPTATKCRFKEIDATNHPGLYEFQFADALFSVANSTHVVVSVTGASATANYEVQLTGFDPYAAEIPLPSNFSSMVIDANGRIDVSKVNGSAINNLISGRVDANAQVVGDKTSYSLTQTFPSNFAAFSIDGNGRVDLSKVIGVSINPLIAGRMDSNAQVVADKTGYSLLAGQLLIQKNVQLTGFPFVMRDATTGAPSAGLTVTATRSIDGAAFSGCANSVTGIANGWYKITLAATDLNGTTIALRFTAATAADTDVTIITQT